MIDRSKPISCPVYIEPVLCDDAETNLINQVKAKRDYMLLMEEWNYRLAHGGHIYVPYQFVTKAATIDKHTSKTLKLLKNRNDAS